METASAVDIPKEVNANVRNPSRIPIPLGANNAMVPNTIERGNNSPYSKLILILYSDDINNEKPTAKNNQDKELFNRTDIDLLVDNSGSFISFLISLDNRLPKIFKIASLNWNKKPITIIRAKSDVPNQMNLVLKKAPIPIMVPANSTNI